MRRTHGRRQHLHPRSGCDGLVAARYSPEGFRSFSVNVHRPPPDPMRGQREAAGVFPESVSEGEVLVTARYSIRGGLPRDLSCS